MQDLRRQMIRVAHQRPHLRAYLVPVLRQDWLSRQGREFATKDEYDKYMKEHPGAVKSKHWIKPKSKKEEWGDRLKGFFSKMKGASTAIVTAVTNAPSTVKHFVVDGEHRKKVLGDLATGIQKSPKKIASHILKQAQSELHDMGHAVMAGRRLFKIPPGPFDKHDRASLYSAGAYVAGSVLALLPPHGAALLAAGALGVSFGLHVGIKSVHQVLDKGFLHFEWADTVFHALHVVASQRTAADKDKASAEFIEGLVRVIADVLKEGISEDDMKKILAGVELPKEADDA